MSKKKEYPKNIRDWSDTDVSRLTSEFLDNARTGSPSFEDMAEEYGVSVEQVKAWEDQTLNNVDAAFQDPSQAVLEQADEDMKKQRNEALNQRTNKILKFIRRTVIVILAVMAIAIGGRFAIQYITAPKPFNPYSYIDVKYTGISGYGSAEPTFNAKKASKDLGKNISQDDVVVSVTDADKALKNGDTVTIKVKDTKALNEKDLTVKPTERDYTVVGLINGSPVDAFKDVQVTFSGTNGDGTAEIKNNSQDSLLQSAEYKLNKTDGLSNGDKIVATVSVDPEQAITTEKYPSETKMEFTVDGLGKYVKAASDLSDAGWKSIESLGAKDVTDDLMGKSTYDWTQFFGMNTPGYDESHVTKKVEKAKLVRAYVISGEKKKDADDSSDNEDYTMNSDNMVYLMCRVNVRLSSPYVPTVGDAFDINNGSGSYLWISYRDVIADSKGNPNQKSLNKIQGSYDSTYAKAYVDLDSMAQQTIQGYRDAGYDVSEKDFKQ